MENDKISNFNDCYQDRGGHFDYKQIDHISFIFKDLLIGCNKDIDLLRKSKPSLPEVNLNFINNPLLNAVASKKNNEYYIGIYVGTWFIIRDLFFRMLSSKNILTEIGDVSKENETQKIFNAQVLNAHTLLLAKEINENIEPKDKTRNHLAQILTSFAIKFLVMHEYGHIIMGHLDYLENSEKVFHWNEINVKENYPYVEPILSQTLEMDADCYAAKIGINQFLHFSDNYSNLKEDLQPFYKSIETILEHWIFSIYTLFRVFSYNNNLNKIKTSSHPHSAIRQQIVFGMVYTIFNQKSIAISLDKLTDIIAKVIKDVEFAFDEISHQGFDPSAIALSFEKESQNHLEFLNQNWNNIRPLLEKYAKAGLAPLYEASSSDFEIPNPDKKDL